MRRLQLRFRSTFLASLLTFVGLTAFLVGATSYYAARFTAQDLSAQVIGQATARVEEQIQQLAQRAVAVTEINGRLVTSRQLGIHDFERLIAYWVEVMGVERQLTSVFVGDEATGESTGVSTLQGELSIWQSHAEGGRYAVREYHPADYPRTPFRYDPDKPGPDIRTRPWYVRAAAARRPIWTETYAFLGVSGVGPVTGVTYARPLLAADGTLSGVFTADFELGQLSMYLASLHVASSGFAVVIETRADGTRQVIAHPARTLDDPRVVALLAATGDTFEVDDTRYIGALRRLSGDGAPPWLVGVIVPEADVMGRVEHSNRISVVIALVGLVLAVGCGLYVARQVARPLEALSLEMAAIGELRLDARPVSHSIVAEVDRVAVAVETIKTGLRQKRMLEKYVPRGAREDIAKNRIGDVALGGVRVRRTILFSDLRGFTAMSEQLAPDAVVRLLNAYLRTMSAAILGHGGDINEYIGDAILAVFADSASAVAAAIAMQAALAAAEDADVRALRMGTRDEPCDGSLDIEPLHSARCLGHLRLEAPRDEPLDMEFHRGGE